MDQQTDIAHQRATPPGDAAPLSVRLITDPRTLLSELEDLLLLQPLETWPETTIVLPTMRLRVHLLARLTKRAKAYFAPRILNFEQFLMLWHETASQSSADRKPLPTSVAEWLVAERIWARQDPAFRHLAPRHAHEAVQIFSEMADRGLSAGVFERLHEILSQDIYRDEQFVSELSHRIDELAELHALCEVEMQESGVCFAADRRADLAACALEQLRLGERPPWTQLVLAGFTSMARVHLPLWSLLAERQDTKILISQPLGAATSSPDCKAARLAESPLGELLTAVGVNEMVSAPPTPATHFKILAFEDVRSEISAVLAMAKGFVEQGHRACDLAILVPDEQTYGLPLKKALAESGLTYNSAIATDFFHTELGQWLRSLVDLLLRADETASLIAFWRHPRTIPYLSVMGAVLPGCSFEVHDELQAALVRVGEHRGLRAKEAILQKSTSALLSEVLEATSQLVAPLLSEPKERPFAAWLAAFRGLLPQNEVHKLSETTADAAAALVALNQVLEQVEGFAAYSRRPSYRLNEFLQLFMDALANEEIREIGEPLVGLQVLSEREARYIPFSVCFILGCVEASYPKALPRDDLLDDYLKERSGLANWQTLEAIQDTTFRLIAATSERVFLTYPRRALDRETIRSRFLESLAVQGVSEDHIVHRTPLADATWIESADSSVRLTAESSLDLLHRGASVSSLETLIKCPLRFALNRLKLGRFQLPDPDDPRNEGSFLHKIFEVYLQNLQVSAPHSTDRHTFVLRSVADLAEIAFHCGPQDVMSSTLGLQLLWHAFPAFANHAFDLYQESDGFDLQLSEFEKSVEAELELDDGRRLPYWGTIDRIDRQGNHWLICDYKRLSFPSRREVMDGLSPQLTLYANALAKRSTGQVDGAMGYWSILKGEAATVAGTIGFKVAPRVVKPPRLRQDATVSSLEAATEAVKKWLGLRLSQHWEAQLPFFADPSRCGTCDYVNVCRKDDPRYKDTIASQDTLSQWLAREKEDRGAADGSDDDLESESCGEPEADGGVW